MLGDPRDFVETLLLTGSWGPRSGLPARPTPLVPEADSSFDRKAQVAFASKG